MSKPHHQPMPEYEHAALRTYLQARGIRAADLAAVVGTSAAGRTRLQVEQALTRWLSHRPRR